MSKTKSTKKAKSNKITKAELEKLQEFNKAMGAVNNNLASIAIAKHDLLKAYDDLKEKFNAFTKALEDTYGNVSISVEDGTISEIPTEEEKAK